ncbi:MAG: hypothetical protein WBF79_03825 [Rhodococcus sp. (in: high G+C Gram-positive bacteria)]
MSNLNDLQISSLAATQCAAACDKFTEELLSVQALVEGHSYGGGFGTLPSGQALEKKYSELAVGGAGSLTSMLQAHITVATNLAATFTEIGKHYQATDDAVAQNVISTDPPR